MNIQPVVTIPRLLTTEEFRDLDTTAQRIHIGIQHTDMVHKLGSLRGSVIEQVGIHHDDSETLNNHITVLRANYQTMMHRYGEVTEGINGGTDHLNDAIEDAFNGLHEANQLHNEMLHFYRQQVGDGFHMNDSSSSEGSEQTNFESDVSSDTNSHVSDA